MVNALKRCYWTLNQKRLSGYWASRRIYRLISRIGYYFSGFGISGVKAVFRKMYDSSEVLIKVENKYKAPFYIRLNTSDEPTFTQIFKNMEYEFEVSKIPDVIIDAGANIGLASIYLTNRYPTAKIISIEPEKSNFDLLVANVAPYPKIVPLRAALWHKNEKISLVDRGLGDWGFMTDTKADIEKITGDVVDAVDGITVDEVMSQHSLSEVDILKIDIEGAEREVFSDTASWIGGVNSIIIELHERMKPGCSRSFYNGSDGFSEEWMQGENIYLSRGLIVQSNK